MENIIAIIIFIIISTIAIYLSIKKQIDNKLTSILLCFAFFSGFGIANYDIIQKIKFGTIEVETARKEINDIKESALKDISKDIEEQKESIRLLITNANDTRDKIEIQRKSLEQIIKTATILEDNIKIQKDEIVDLNNASLQTKKEIEKLNQASAQIALILVRATYFTIETKSEFGTERAQKAIDEIISDLNKILPMVIPNRQQRDQWIKNMQKTLPARNE